MCKSGIFHVEFFKTQVSHRAMTQPNVQISVFNHSDIDFSTFSVTLFRLVPIHLPRYLFHVRLHPKFSFCFHRVLSVMRVSTLQWAVTAANEGKSNEEERLGKEKIRGNKRTQLAVSVFLSSFLTAAVIGLPRRAKNDRVIMQHFPTQRENTSTYVIKVFSRREIRESAQGSARDVNLHLPTYLRSLCLFLNFSGVHRAPKPERVGEHDMTSKQRDNDRMMTEKWIHSQLSFVVKRFFDAIVIFCSTWEGFVWPILRDGFRETEKGWWARLSKRTEWQISWI